MDNSILVSTKKALGLEKEYTIFDVELISYINGVFADLSQLGIGPAEGYAITNHEETWDAFFEDVNLNQIKPYVTLKVKMMFDPPGTSFHITAMQEQIREMEYRLNTVREVNKWTEVV